MGADQSQPGDYSWVIGDLLGEPPSLTKMVFGETEEGKRQRERTNRKVPAIFAGKSPREYETEEKVFDLYHEVNKLHEEQRNAVYERWKFERLLPDDWRDVTKYTWENLQKMEHWIKRYKNVPPVNLHLAREIINICERLTEEQWSDAFEEINAALEAVNAPGLDHYDDGKGYNIQFMPLRDLERIEQILRRYPLGEHFTSGSSVNGLVSLLVLGGIYLALKNRGRK